jgi:hypothetical protein
MTFLDHFHCVQIYLIKKYARKKSTNMLKEIIDIGLEIINKLQIISREIPKVNPLKRYNCNEYFPILFQKHLNIVK